MTPEYTLVWYGDGYLVYDGDRIIGRDEQLDLIEMLENLGAVVLNRDERVDVREVDYEDFDAVMAELDWERMTTTQEFADTHAYAVTFVGNLDQLGNPYPTWLRGRMVIINPPKDNQVGGTSVPEVILTKPIPLEDE